MSIAKHPQIEPPEIACLGPAPSQGEDVSADPQIMSARSLDDYPETLTFAQVRDVLGIDQIELRRMQKTGALPPSLPGTRRLAKAAIKARLAGVDQPRPAERTIEDEEQEILRRIKTGAQHGRDRRVRALS